MHKETFCEAERRRLEKLNNFQLAHSYKRVGWTVVAISFALMIVKGFIDEPSWVKPVLSNIFLIGFLIISLSKEKVEDELIISLRAQSYRLAFVFAVIYTLIQPYISYGVDLLIQKEDPVVQMSYFQVLVFMLVVQLGFFESLKRYS